VLVPLAPIPIFQETIPSKIFEVLACGRPFVAALGGEGAKITEASGAGRVVPPGNPAELASAIGAMLEMTHETREAMGLAGRAWVQQHYDRVVLADRYFDLLSSLAAS
jgi:glycosyltransferase involved in cell wall biosynthesis